MNIRSYAIAMSVFALTACSTTGRQPELAAAEVRAKLQSSRVNVQAVAQPVMLSERTKAQATGNFLASSLVGSLAGSTGHAANPQAMQANMQVGQAFGQQMQQALPDDVAVASGHGADVALTAKLAEYFAGMQPEKVNSEVAIQVNARKWELGYESYLTSSDYVLSYNFEVVASEVQTNEVRVLKTVSCQGQADRKMPLDDWRNEEYREVNAAAEHIVESCFKRVLKDMALPSPEST